MRSVGCLETSVVNYKSKLRKVPEERISQMQRRTETRLLSVGRVRTEATSEVWEGIGYRTKQLINGWEWNGGEGRVL
jgi:hypothetical protein